MRLSQSHIQQNILITGATGGIGSALAEIYSGPEKTLLLTGRDKTRLDEIARKCMQKGATVIQKAFDITDTATLTEWLQELMKKIKIDLVIANAGISSGINSHGRSESLETTHQLFNVNLLSVINTINPIIDQMRHYKKGQVAIMSSLAAWRGLPHSPAYCASKAAIKVYGESLRSLLAPDGIKVSIICPGFVKTAMSDKVIGPKPFLMSAQEAAKIIERKLRKNVLQIAFPLPLTFALKLLNLLPKQMSDKLLVKIKSYVKE